MDLSTSGRLNRVIESLRKRAPLWPETSCLSVPMEVLRMHGIAIPEEYESRYGFESESAMIEHFEEKFGNIRSAHLYALRNAVYQVSFKDRQVSDLLMLSLPLLSCPFIGVMGPDGFAWIMTNIGAKPIEVLPMRVLEVLRCRQ